jgi:hypothetical protein
MIVTPWSRPKTSPVLEWSHCFGVELQKVEAYPLPLLCSLVFAYTPWSLNSAHFRPLHRSCRHINHLYSCTFTSSINASAKHPRSIQSTHDSSYQRVQDNDLPIDRKRFMTKSNKYMPYSSTILIFLFPLSSFSPRLAIAAIQGRKHLIRTGFPRSAISFKYFSSALLLWQSEI